MKKRITAAILAAVLLCGCSSGNESSVNVIDAGQLPVQSNLTDSENASSVVSSDTSESKPVPVNPPQTASGTVSSTSSSVPISSGSSISASSSSVHSAVTEKPSSSRPVSSTAESSKPVSTAESLPESVSSSSTSTTKAESSLPTQIPDTDVGTNNYQALNYSEIRGVWISYIDLADLDSSSESEFRKSIGKVYDNCVSLGINTVYVHTRSHGDAYYSSDLYPRTKYIGGSYDPLTVMVEEAHKRDLSFQAWINPLRTCSAADIEREKGYPIYNWAGGTRLVQVGSYYYLNPAYSEVIDLIAKGAAEIVGNYDVDGLHIDDYFYPTTESWFDSSAFAQSSYETISSFRLANCDNMVSSLYYAVKSSNPTAIFGVSCQGNIYNNYDQMYADVKKWCRNSGYLDYIMPQIYFGFDNSAQPFETCVSQWDEIASSGKVPLIVGLTVAKFGTEDKWAGSGSDEWITDKDILKRQFLKAAEQVSFSGINLFSYRCIFNPDSSVADQVNREIKALKSVM